MRPERASIEDLQAIVASLPEFWGERDAAALHQALFVHELGDTALVIRDGEGRVIAYLLGFVSPARVGYVHVVAVRRSHRGAGLARSLYESFESLARELGALELKAITRPSNRASHDFHRALGFTASEVSGYSATGEARTVFRRALH
jgi:GNAT superfamily N-acetyltransferase